MDAAYLKAHLMCHTCGPSVSACLCGPSPPNSSTVLALTTTALGLCVWKAVCGARRSSRQGGETLCMYSWRRWRKAVEGKRVRMDGKELAIAPPERQPMASCARGHIQRTVVVVRVASGENSRSGSSSRRRQSSAAAP